jgi:hypothetical protein
MCPAPAHTMDRPPAPNPAPEVEVTPEMVRAGIEANPLFTSDLEIEEEAVIAIYRAMRKAESIPVRPARS